MSGPWDPGIESPVPAPLLHLCTIFRRENVFTTFSEARELHGLTGLPYTELIALRPERLALHELLIRVSADFSVPDGERIEDLGINFRRMTREIFASHIAPHSETIAARYEESKKALSRVITGELRTLANEPLVHAERISQWRTQAQGGGAVQRAAFHAVETVVSSVLARHGRIWGTPDLLATIATHIACNALASEEIGRLISPWIADAAQVHGYRLLPDQSEPVVMNTKGASASGKSTIRPLQRTLAGEIGARWGDFALISPDIWRKQLLDYSSLGDAYKYAGAFTGDELQIVDHKLDEYMARKADGGHMSHLLIDRFRFDSFAPDSDVAGSNLLTRFGQIVYLFFMITPPAELVERAWKRGLEVGRYKAVDDTLAHGVEAYSGMPELFFTWVSRSDKRVHFEFLDNTVRLGERPRTVAFGWNDTLTVLDVKCMLDVERYRRVNANARSSDQVFSDSAQLAPEKNTGFIKACVARFAQVNFARQDDASVYLELRRGAVVACDAGALKRAAADPDTRAGLAAVTPEFSSLLTAGAPAMPKQLTAERSQTVGRWGP